MARLGKARRGWAWRGVARAQCAQFTKEHMMATNVFFGGVPTGAEVNKLIEAFGVPAEGETITHEEIEAALGLAKDTNRYRTVTTAWRKKMLVDNNLDTCAVPGEGFRFMPPAERVSAGLKGIKQASKKQLKSIKRVCSVRTDDPGLVHKQLLATRFGVALSDAHNSLMKQIALPGPTEQAPRINRNHP